MLPARIRRFRKVRHTSLSNVGSTHCPNTLASTLPSVTSLRFSVGQKVFNRYFSSKPTHDVSSTASSKKKSLKRPELDVLDAAQLVNQIMAEVTGRHEQYKPYQDETSYTDVVEYDDIDQILSITSGSPEIDPDVSDSIIHDERKSRGQPKGKQKVDQTRTPENKTSPKTSKKRGLSPKNKQESSQTQASQENLDELDVIPQQESPKRPGRHRKSEISESELDQQQVSKKRARPPKAKSASKAKLSKKQPAPEAEIAETEVPKRRGCLKVKPELAASEDIQEPEEKPKKRERSPKKDKQESPQSQASQTSSDELNVSPNIESQKRPGRLRKNKQESEPSKSKRSKTDKQQMSETSEHSSKRRRAYLDPNEQWIQIFLKAIEEEPTRPPRPPPNKTVAPKKPKSARKVKKKTESRRTKLQASVLKRIFTSPGVYKGSVDKQVPASHVNDIRKAVYFMAKDLKIEDGDYDKWYTISRRDFASLLSSPKYQNIPKYATLAELLPLAYPEHEWQHWRLQTPLRPLYWKNKEYQKKFLWWLGLKLGIKTWSDWYSLTKRQVKDHGGVGLLALHNDSIQNLVMSVFPNKSWLPWNFVDNSNADWWRYKGHQRDFVEWLARRLTTYPKNILDAMYKITFFDIMSNGGAPLFRIYGRSAYKVIKGLYPNHAWCDWLFAEPPSKWWLDEQNQRNYIEWLIRQNSYETLEQCYNLTRKIFITTGGRHLLKHYGSMFKLFQHLYPSHEWLPWKFGDFWTEKNIINNIKQYMLPWFKDHLKIVDMSGWYQLTYTLLQQYDATAALSSTVNRHQAIYSLLKQAYPSHSWDPTLFAKSSPYIDRLRYYFRKIIPTNRATLEYDYKLPILYKQSGTPIILQLFWKEANIAFEYVEPEDLFDVEGLGNLFIGSQHRQEERAAMCALHGISVITIPYWWVPNMPALRAAINSVNPRYLEAVLPIQEKQQVEWDFDEIAEDLRIM